MWSHSTTITVQLWPPQPKITLIPVHNLHGFVAPWAQAFEICWISPLTLEAPDICGPFDATNPPTLRVNPGQPSVERRGKVSKQNRYEPAGLLRKLLKKHIEFGGSDDKLRLIWTPSSKAAPTQQALAAEVAGRWDAAIVEFLEILETSPPCPKISIIRYMCSLEINRN